MAASPHASPAAPGRPRYALWPAVAATVITGLGFASIKFVLIGEQAMVFDPEHIRLLPFEWMRQVMTACTQQNLAREAITQGLAAVLTLGVLLGYVINCPLAGAWRAAPMFALSCVGVGAASLLAIALNAWAIALVIGMCYGAACAARGKVIPLLAEGTGRHNTFVSGLMNASLVIGLLAGTVVGLGLADAFIGSAAGNAADGTPRPPKPPFLLAAPWLAHACVAGMFAVGVAIALRVRTPDSPTIPFATGLRHLIGDTADLLRRHWALLVSGGIIWGVAAAASLTVLVWSITEVKMPPVVAGTISVFAAVGAIIGNLVSDRINRRRWAVACLLGLTACLFLVEHVLVGYVSGAVLMTIVGVLFAAPANIVDARLLHLANSEGVPGRGSTVMSLVHNLFILLVGVGLAVPLFLGVIKAVHQFWILAGFVLLAAVVTLFAELRPQGGTSTDLPKVD